MDVFCFNIKVVIQVCATPTTSGINDKLLPEDEIWMVWRQGGGIHIACFVAITDRYQHIAPMRLKNTMSEGPGVPLK